MASPSEIERLALAEQEELANQGFSQLPRIIHFWLLPGSKGEHFFIDNDNEKIRYDFVQDQPPNCLFGNLIYGGIALVMGHIPLRNIPNHFLSKAAWDSFQSSPVPAAPVKPSPVRVNDNIRELMPTPTYPLPSANPPVNTLLKVGSGQEDVNPIIKKFNDLSTSFEDMSKINKQLRQELANQTARNPAPSPVPALASARAAVPAASFLDIYRNNVLNFKITPTGVSQIKAACVLMRFLLAIDCSDFSSLKSIVKFEKYTSENPHHTKIIFQMMKDYNMTACSHIAVFHSGIIKPVSGFTLMPNRDSISASEIKNNLRTIFIGYWVSYWDHKDTTSNTELEAIYSSHVGETPYHILKTRLFVARL